MAIHRVHAPVSYPAGPRGYSDYPTHLARAGLQGVSETKFGLPLIVQCLIYRINCALDTRKVIAAQLIDGGTLKAFDDGAAVADKLFAQDGQFLTLGHSISPKDG